MLNKTIRGHSGAAVGRSYLPDLIKCTMTSGMVGQARAIAHARRNIVDVKGGIVWSVLFSATVSLGLVMPL